MRSFSDSGEDGDPHGSSVTVEWPGRPRRAVRRPAQADLRRWRWIRRRSRSVVPPQIPSRSRLARACSRQASRTAHCVVTGVTGQVGEPVACALARDNEVYGAARFRDAAARERLEAAGVRCVAIDLASGDVGALPADADVVLNFAVTKTNDWDVDLQANSGGLAWLMEHHREARAFLHCSTTGVYKPMGHHVFAESDPGATTTVCGPFCGPTASARSRPKPRPGGRPNGSHYPPPSPVCRSPTAIAVDGRPFTSR
jgi:hypothetical protein